VGSHWWTSGTDAGCPGKLAWCGARSFYSEAESGLIEDWKKDKSGGICVTVRAAKPPVLVADNCTRFLRPLCEVSALYDFILSYCGFLASQLIN
jgi:hypothetical protein